MTAVIPFHSPKPALPPRLRRCTSSSLPASPPKQTSFLARPLLSDDGQGSDKHKMERFMQPGGSFVGSVYAPISYMPLPMLAFKVC